MVAGAADSMFGWAMPWSAALGEASVGPGGTTVSPCTVAGGAGAVAGCACAATPVPRVSEHAIAAIIAARTVVAFRVVREVDREVVMEPDFRRGLLDKAEQ